MPAAGRRTERFTMVAHTTMSGIAMGFDPKVTDRYLPLAGKPLVCHPGLGGRGLGRLVLGKSAELLEFCEGLVQPAEFVATEGESDEKALVGRTERLLAL